MRLLVCLLPGVGLIACVGTAGGPTATGDTAIADTAKDTADSGPEDSDSAEPIDTECATPEVPESITEPVSTRELVPECEYDGGSVRASPDSPPKLLAAEMEACDGVRAVVLYDVETLAEYVRILPEVEYETVSGTRFAVDPDTGRMIVAVAHFYDDNADGWRAETWLYDAVDTTPFASIGAVYNPWFSGGSFVAADMDVDDGRGAIYLFDPPFDGDVPVEDAVAVQHGQVRNGFLGNFMREVGDVDGDGLGDGVVETPTNTFISGASLRVDDGLFADGVPLSFGMQTGGESATPAGDVDGDGLPDFAISSQAIDVDRGGKVGVYSGVGPTLVATLYDGESELSELTADVGQLGDIGADGSPVLVVTVEEEDAYSGEEIWLIPGGFCGTQNIGDLGTKYHAADGRRTELARAVPGTLIWWASDGVNPKSLTITEW